MIRITVTPATPVTEDVLDEYTELFTPDLVTVMTVSRNTGFDELITGWELTGWLKDDEKLEAINDILANAPEGYVATISEL